MKIAVVHSFYRDSQPSGENNLVLGQVKALEAMGHDVTIIARHSPDKTTHSLYALRAAVRVLTGSDAGLTGQLESLNADAIFLHNLFPNFGWKWIERFHGRTYAFMHNYRFSCAAGNFFREGKVCQDCMNGSSISAIRHKCYGNSSVATIPLAWLSRGSRHDHPVYSKIQHFVVGSRLASRVLQQWGVSGEEVSVVPNYTKAQVPIPVGNAHLPWAFAGRFVAEKGVLELVRDFPETKTLEIFGGGPLEPLIQGALRSNIKLMGMQANDILQARLRAYCGVMVPSIWYEVNPVGAAEAFARSQPVVALESNAVGDELLAVDPNLVFRDASSLATALEYVSANYPELQVRVRSHYEDFYSFRSWSTSIAKLLDS